MSLVETTIGQLKAALQQVLKAVDTKRVTLQFKAGQLFVHACEGDARARALVHTIGAVADALVVLPGKNLLAIISSYKVDAICTITSVDGGLRFNFGGAKVTLKAFGEADIELFENRVSGFGFLLTSSFKARDLTTALTSVERFAARDGLRMEMRGVLFQSVDSKLTLVATDGFRLAENITSMDAPGMQPMILPVCFAETLRAVLKDEDSVELAVLGEKDVRRVRFSTPTFRLDCPLIAGAYPNYKAVIPIPTAALTLDSRALASAIERMAIVSGHYVRLRLEAEHLTVSSVDGASSETLEIETGAEPFGTLDVGFLAKLLAESLAAVTSELVTILFEPSAVENMRLVLKNVGTTDGWQAIVMSAKV
jgi:DNA polymerase III sliding clamp (beta) subunit (PCNA family)